MSAKWSRAEEERLAREILEQIESIGDATNLTSNELVRFDMRRNEILEELAPLARMLADPGTFKSVSAGGSHTCAIRTNDTAACWGANQYNQSTPLAGTTSRSAPAGSTPARSAPTTPRPAGAATPAAS